MTEQETVSKAASPAEVTKIYNAKQDAVGLTLLRVWVPAPLAVAIRRDLEAEKAEYLLSMVEAAELDDPRVHALAQRNVAAPLPDAQLATLTLRMANSKNRSVVELLEERLTAHNEAAAASERHNLQGRLAERDGDPEAVKHYARAVVHGYLLRAIKSELTELGEKL